MHQAHQSMLEKTIPEPPLRTIELCQCVAPNPMIRNCVYTFRELLQVRKLHSNVEPIQHVLCVWRNLPVNGS
jgi:hypothetical protein